MKMGLVIILKVKIDFLVEEKKKRGKKENEF